MIGPIGLECAPPAADAPTSMIARVTRILEVFEGPHDRLALAEVVHRTQLPNSTTHRILDALVKLGWVEQSSCTYRLGHRARRLSDEAGHLHLRSIAHPYLQALHVRTGMKVFLSALEGGDAACIDRIGSGGSADSAHKVGQKRHLHHCAVGRAMLHELTDSPQDVIAASCSAAEVGECSWTPAALRREFDLIRRRRGLSVGRRYESQDVDCMAVAIPLPGAQCAAICLHSAMQREQVATHARALLRTACLIGNELPTHSGRPHTLRMPA